MSGTVSSTACGLDIGSNTFSFSEIAEQGGGVVILRDDSVGVRLSEGLRSGGQLRPAAIERGLRTLSAMTEKYELPEKNVRVVATAALRNAANPSAFTAPAEALLGHPIEIIDGKEEARLTREGAVVGLREGARWIMLDIGGQSTEFSWHSPDRGWDSVSLEMGAVGLTEQFLREDPPSREALSALRAHVRRQYQEHLPRDIEGTLLAVAGTASSLGMLHQGLERYDRDRIHGSEMDREALTHWMTVMSSVTSRARYERYGVRPVRADVFPAGICLIEEALRYFDRGAFTISTTGLRLGAAISLLRALG